VGGGAGRSADDEKRAGDPRARRASGELEGDVLAVLWSADDAMTPGQVHEALGSDLAYTTVATILGRLLDKGLVERRKVGRAHAYVAVTDEADVASAGFRSVLTRSHDRQALLQGFVDSLSPEEEEIVRDLLGAARRARREGRP
jgi:predicted transcriptional regulator